VLFITTGTLEIPNVSLEQYNFQKLNSLEEIWGVPNQLSQINFEWNPKLRVTLGIAYPKRNLVRLNIILQQPELAHLLEEVVCHEVAHIAAYHLHGPKIKIHGPEWRDLIIKAGFQPRTTLSSDFIQQPLAPSSHQYAHTCLVCQSSRLSAKPQPKWRCAECQEAGLDGVLRMQSHPNSGALHDA
jgi:predicted SprT family Zn-dependent metalloprotease